MRNLREWQQIVERERTQYFVIPPRGGGGGGTINASWLTLMIAGGNTLDAGPPAIDGIKAVAGILAAAWITPPVTASLTASISAGAVSAINIVNRGAAYASAPAITIAPPPSGTTATATCTIGDHTVAVVKLTNCGSGYTTASVAFSAPGGGGVTATGTCVISGGKVVRIDITDPGTLYAAAPSVTITGDGASAAGDAIMDKGRIKAITLSGGSGYTTAPAVTVDAPVVDPSVMADTDGSGIAQVTASYLTAYAVGDYVRVVNDERSSIRFSLVAAAIAPGPVSLQDPDVIIAWAYANVSLIGAAADAWPVMPCWIPMGGGV